MQIKLLVWLRQNGVTQRALAKKAGRSDAWISKLIKRDISDITDDDLDLVEDACRASVGRDVRPSDLFTFKRPKRRTGKAA